MQTLLGRHLEPPLESDQNGELNQSAVDTRQAYFGPNVISEKRKQRPLVRFLLQFHQPSSTSYLRLSS